MKTVARQALALAVTATVALGMGVTPLAAATPSAAAAPLSAAQPSPAGQDRIPHRARDPLVIGHRGASGYRPEHTLAPTNWPPGWAPTSSSRTWCRPRTTSWSPATRTRSPARRTSRTIPSSPTARRPRPSTASRHRLVHRGLHPRRAQDTAGDGAAARRCGSGTPSTTDSSRSRRSRRYLTCASGCRGTRP